MEYIVHHRCREISAAGEPMNLPYGSTFGTVGDFIATPEGKALCYATSETALKYFARNDDGKGLERGEAHLRHRLQPPGAVGYMKK